MRNRTKRPVSLFESIEARILFSQSVLSNTMVPTPIALPIESINGTGNNLAHATWGSAGTDLLRLSPVAYGDGISTPSGATRPSARAVSNAISAQSTDIVNNRNLSDIVYVFGQFLDHDIDLTPSGTSETFNVAVPTGDPSFDPASTGTQTIGFTRSIYDPTTGTSKKNPRQQTTTVTAFIDGSMIYGSDSVRAAALRTFSGGLMKTSTGNLLPKNTAGLANANDAHIVADNQLFLAGDVRANENIELTAMQTLFVREHNRIATSLAQQHPTWTDEQIFQEARRTVIAELQSITFNEFLPALLGKGAIKPYEGYDPKVNPSIATEFSTAGYRFGHSMLDNEIDRLNNDGTVIPEGSVDLKNAFFNPTLFDPSLANNEGNIDPILKGASSGDAQEIDAKVVDDVRNFLFGPPGSGGFDLASLNIQRGRDHGLADYNTVRASYGLPKVTSFSQITSDPALAASLKATYGSVDNIDLWVGGLAETHAPGSSVGPTFQRIIADQFTRLRDGDRFWFENTMSGKQLDAIEHTTLSDIIKRNTSITNLQPDVFLYSATGATGQGGGQGGSQGGTTQPPPHQLPPPPQQLPPPGGQQQPPPPRLSPPPSILELGGQTGNPRRPDSVLN